MATAVSLSVRRKRQTVLWSARGLPSDAFALVAVPDRPAALVLCPHVILYCHQVWSVYCSVCCFFVDEDVSMCCSWVDLLTLDPHMKGRKELEDMHALSQRCVRVR